jgi:hypothetical protein
MYCYGIEYSRLARSSHLGYRNQWRGNLNISTLTKTVGLKPSEL